MTKAARDAASLAIAKKRTRGERDSNQGKEVQVFPYTQFDLHVHISLDYFTRFNQLSKSRLKVGLKITLTNSLKVLILNTLKRMTLSKPLPPKHPKGRKKPSLL